MKHAIRAGLAAAALGLALVSSPRIAAADGDDTALTNLVALASQRLALAEPVARWKWANGKPIEDRPREAELLATVEKRAAQAGVDPAFARTFFADQIAASKDVQNALFATWRATQPPEGTPPDLATGTRPNSTGSRRRCSRGSRKSGSCEMRPTASRGSLAALPTGRR